MSNGVNELKNLDLEFVASKSHIAQNVIDDIINKRFEKINPVKAKGFIKILEREFSVDLSEWTDEFDEYLKSVKPQIQTLDKINNEALVNSKKPISKAALIGVIAAALVGLGYILYPSGDESKSLTEKNVTESQSEVKSQVSAAQISRSFEQNVSTAVEQNATKQTFDANGTLYAEPSSRVWIGIKYLDTNTSSWFETTTAEKFEFNASRKQLIVFGHSLVKVVAGSFATAPKEGGKIRYYYDSGKLTEISEGEYNKLMGRKKPKKEANATVSQEQNGE